MEMACNRKYQSSRVHGFFGEVSKNRTAFFVVLLLLISPACFSGDATTVDVNGGFENNSGDSVAKWRLFGPPKDQIISSERRHAGARALRIPVSADLVRQITGAQQQLDPSLFKPGDTVRLSAYVYMSASGGAKVALEFFGPDRQLLNAVIGKPQSVRDAWQKIEATGTVPEGFDVGGSVKLIANVFLTDPPAGEGEITFDDIEVAIESSAGQ